MIDIIKNTDEKREVRQAMDVKERAAKLNTAMRDRVPLVHNITNYVTVNDCANALLAIGASPIMADDVKESADITEIAKALVINIGTLNQRTVASMIASGKRANQLGIPVIFDPVGAGASNFRNDTTRQILDEVNISVLRGNLSEISYIAGLRVSTKGVDVSERDNENDPVQVAGNVALKYNCTAAITGAIDVVSDGSRTAKIKNGHPLLSKVTGTGCMTTAITGGYAGAGDDMWIAAIAGIVSMGIAGEIAWERAGHLGTGSFHMALMDALSNMDEKRIKELGYIEEGRD